VPRFSLYAVLFTVLTIYYALNLVTIDFFAFFGLLFGGLGSAIFWFGSHQDLEAETLEWSTLVGECSKIVELIVRVTLT